MLTHVLASAVWVVVVLAGVCVAVVVLMGLAALFADLRLWWWQRKWDHLLADLRKGRRVGPD